MRTLLLLALFSAVGCGQGFFRVRASMLSGLLFAGTVTPFGLADFGDGDRFDCQSVSNPRRNVFSVVLGVFGLLDRARQQLSAFGTQCNQRWGLRALFFGELLHPFNFASKRARRQGPAVLETTEESANTQKRDA